MNYSSRSLLTNGTAIGTGGSTAMFGLIPDYSP